MTSEVLGELPGFAAPEVRAPEKLKLLALFLLPIHTSTFDEPLPPSTNS